MALTFIPRLFKNLDAVGSSSSGGGLSNANNALSVSGTTVQWGGDLIKDTEIDGAFNLVLGSKTRLTSIDFSTGSGPAENSGFFMDAYEAGFQHSESSDDIFGFVQTNTNETVMEYQRSGMSSPSRFILNDLGVGIDTQNNTVFHAFLKTTNVTADRFFEFPNTSGTLALLSDVTASISDDPYSSSWNGVVSVGASKNSLYDKIETLVSKLTGNILFSFDSPSDLGITTDNGNYNESFIYLSSTSVSIGFDSNTVKGNFLAEAGRVAVQSFTGSPISLEAIGGDIRFRTVGLFYASFTTNLITTANRNFVLPDASGTLALKELNVRSISATDTALITDDVIEITSGTLTVNLYTAVGNKGKQLIISNQGTGVVTVDPSSTETINGSLTKSLNQYDSLKIISNGSNWIII